MRSRKRSLSMNGSILTIGFGLFLLLMVVIEKIGVPRGYAIAASAVFGLLLVILPVLPGATTRASKYFFAERATGTTMGALSICAIVALPLVTIGSGPLFADNPAILVLVSVALCAGLALAALFVARPLRRSGATSLVNYQFEFFDSTTVARLAALINAIAGFLMILCAFKVLTGLGTWFFGLSGFSTTLIISTLVIMTGAFGGSASTSRQAALAIVTLLVAVNIVLIRESVSVTNFPFGHLSFGSAALDPLLELEADIRAADIPLLQNITENTLSIASWSAGQLVIAGLLITFGIASIPAVFQQFSMIVSPQRAVRAGEKAILFFAFLTLSIFALMAFQKLSLYQTLLGITAEEVREEAKFLYEWSSHNPGLASVCGEFATDANAVMAACGGRADTIINLGDLRFNGDLMFVTTPALLNFPFAFTAFLVIACMLTLIAITSSFAFSIANNLVGAFYSARVDKVDSVEIFLSRFTILLTVASVAVVAGMTEFDISKVTLLSLGLYAACLWPCIFAMFTWPRTTPNAVITGMITGFLITVIYWILSAGGVDITPGTGDEISLGFPGIADAVPAELGGIFALVVSTSCVFGMTYLSRNRKTDREQTEFDAANFSDEGDVTIARNRF